MTRMMAGDFGVPGRFAGLDELGWIEASALDVVGMHRPSEPVVRNAPPLSQPTASASTPEHRK